MWRFAGIQFIAKPSQVAARRASIGRWAGERFSLSILPDNWAVTKLKVISREIPNELPGPETGCDFVTGAR
jgi:hypothetical protein